MQCWLAILMLSWALVGCQISHSSHLVFMKSRVAFRPPFTTEAGQKVVIPDPVLWPTAAMNTPEFQQWAQTGNVTQLKYRDPQGRLYVGNFEFIFHRPNDNQRYAYLSKLSRYRADGTLEATTLFNNGADPNEWGYFRADGVSPKIKVRQQEGTDDNLRIAEVTLYNDAGRAETYSFSEQGEPARVSTPADAPS